MLEPSSARPSSIQNTSATVRERRAKVHPATPIKAAIPTQTRHEPGYETKSKARKKSYIREKRSAPASRLSDSARAKLWEAAQTISLGDSCWNKTEQRGTMEQVQLSEREEEIASYRFLLDRFFLRPDVRACRDCFHHHLLLLSTVSSSSRPR